MTALSADLVRERFDYDPVTGNLRRKGPRATAAGSSCGTRNSKGYLQVSIGNRIYLVHRVVWLHVTGQWPTAQIDHINGDKADNRWTNLRDVTAQVNSQNQRRAQPHNKVGLLGVVKINRPLRRPYRAMLVVNKTAVYLGMHATAEAAHAAYVTAKRVHHEGCTL
jgi:hypothetical protein